MWGLQKITVSSSSPSFPPSTAPFHVELTRFSLRFAPCRPPSRSSTPKLSPYMVSSVHHPSSSRNQANGV